MDDYNNRLDNEVSDIQDISQGDLSTPEPEVPPEKELLPLQETNKLAVASMVIGIFALLSNFCCCFPAGFILGVVSIALVILSKKQKPFSGFAVAGLVLSILSLIASIALFIYLIFVYGMIKDPQYGPMINDMIRQYQEIYESMPAN